MFLVLGLLFALLLQLAGALSLAEARLVGVTTQRCHARNTDYYIKHIVRRYPVDDYATYFTLSNCDLTDDDLSGIDFIGLPNVTEILLYNNRVRQINLDILRSVPTLINAYFNINRIRELPVFDEKACPNLKLLYLNSNLLTELNNPGTFSACVKLNELSLSLNKIEYIHPDVFSSLTELKVLKLEENQIRYIPDRMLANNNKLNFLRINNNRLTFLPAGFVTSVKHSGAPLEHFYFYDNPWKCACLLEVLAEVKREGVPYYQRYPFEPVVVLNRKIMQYNGTRPECVYSGQKSNLVCPFE